MAKETNTFVRTVPPHSAVESVLAEIRRSIVFGALKPGQEFSLRETATQLGVSTAPVREALRVLQGEGLVVARRARSVVVAPMDAADLRSIYALRRLIEPSIAARSSSLLSDEGLASLERLVDEISDQNRSIDDVYETHREFHLALLRPAATVWDLRVLETLWHAAERYVRVGFGRLDPLPEEHKRRGDAHRSILDAFRRRNADGVHDAVLQHLDENERIALRMIGPSS